MNGYVKTGYENVIFNEGDPQIGRKLKKEKQKKRRSQKRIMERISKEVMIYGNVRPQPQNHIKTLSEIDNKIQRKIYGK